MVFLHWKRIWAHTCGTFILWYIYLFFCAELPLNKKKCEMVMELLDKQIKVSASEHIAQHTCFIYFSEKRSILFVDILPWASDLEYWCVGKLSHLQIYATLVERPYDRNERQLYEKCPYWQAWFVERLPSRREMSILTDMVDVQCFQIYYVISKM